MALGRQGETQGELMVGWAEMPRSPGHAFYDRLQEVLTEDGFRRLRRGAVRGALRLAPWSPVAAAGAVLPHAPRRLFRGHLLRAWPRMALLGQPVAARIPALGTARAGARPFVAEPDPRPAAGGGARCRLRLGAGPAGRARADPGRADRHRRLDDGGRRRAAHHCAPRQRRDLSADAAPDGRGERHRDADRRRPDPPRPRAQGQEALERRLDLAGRPRRPHRQDEGRDHASGLQAGACRRSRHRRHRRRRGPQRRSRRHRHLARHAERRRDASASARQSADRRGAGRARRRQGLPFPRRPEGARRRRLEEPHRREAAPGGLPLARRSRRPPRRLQQPRPAALRGRQGRAPAPRRARRAQLRPGPGSWRDATNLVARPHQRPQTLPAARRWLQSRVDHAPADRPRHPAGGRSGPPRRRRHSFPRRRRAHPRRHRAG